MTTEYQQAKTEYERAKARDGALIARADESLRKEKILTWWCVGEAAGIALFLLLGQYLNG